jgi:hypothetical protein
MISTPTVSAYICGDVDNSGQTVDISDLIYLVTYMFQEGPAPIEMEAAYVNGQGQIDISNLIYLVTYMFQGGPGLVCGSSESLSYPIVQTGLVLFYDDTDEITAPTAGQPFYGQDATHQAGAPLSYFDNGDGTISDLSTGLMWVKNPGDKLVYDHAVLGADTCSLAGYNDWRLPTIKELYSLIIFSGLDPSGYTGSSSSLRPFVDTTYFDFEYGDESSGERIIDAQFWSSTEYVGTTMNGDATTFGVNFADGRIKGYPAEPIGPPGNQRTMTSFVRFVRGNLSYGTNDFSDNGDGTVTDSATGLMWTQSDDGTGLVWEDALSYAEGLDFASYDDWRLPTAKELQSILDYSRSPATSGTAAIDPIFSVTAITVEEGTSDFPFYWSSSTHANMGVEPGAWGAYLAFGTAFGFMESPPGSGQIVLQDVHGAGAQRSDPKVGNPADWPEGHGPQGDVIRIYNFVRCVRDAN